MGDALSDAGQSRPRARIAADARAEAGLGHLARCTALACALGEEGFELETIGLGAPAAIELDGIAWLPEGPGIEPGPEPDFLVLDAYDEDDWRRISATPHGRLVEFVDAQGASDLADVIISQEGEFRRHKKQLVLHGLQYACLRRDFWNLPEREIRDPARRVLLTTGGGDIDGLAGRLVAGLTEHCPPETEIELVWGPGFSGEPPPGVTLLERPRSLRDALLGADVVVCTGGQTMLEAAATGAPIVAIEATPNQHFQIGALRDAEGIFETTEHVAPVVAATMIRFEEVRQQRSHNARKAVDGRGALRIASELAALERR